jgi:hypothetical protein
MISDGNVNQGGLKKLKEFCGIFGEHLIYIGFVKFTESLYLILITKKSQVSLIAGHFIYHIDETFMIKLGNSVTDKKSPSESKYLQIFGGVDVSKNLYFSYSYDITNSLQYNLTTPENEQKPNSMFVWNDFLTREYINPASSWNIKIIHGFVDQTSIYKF